MILCIDPGPVNSAYVIMQGLKIQDKAIVENEKLLKLTKHELKFYEACIEMVASYGMPVGASVFETCVWIGRFVQSIDNDLVKGYKTQFVYRKQVKIHLCNSVKANDASIRQAIMDKYGFTKQIAIGSKSNQGPLYGVKKDIWSAIAVGLTYQGI